MPLLDAFLRSQLRDAKRTGSVRGLLWCGEERSRDGGISSAYMNLFTLLGPGAASLSPSGDDSILSRAVGRSDVVVPGPDARYRYRWGVGGRTTGGGIAFLDESAWGETRIE